MGEFATKYIVCLLYTYICPIYVDLTLGFAITIITEDLPPFVIIESAEVNDNS